MTLEVTRRAVVGAAGAAGALSVLPLAGALAATTQQVRVGFLTTSGASFAGAADGLVDGFSLAAAAGGLEVVAARRELAAGYGGALTAAQELIDGGAELIVAGVSSQVLDQLALRCSLARVGLVGANSGARVLTRTSVPMLVNSLQVWQSWFVAGGWAARRLGRRMFVVAAAPDAGYDTVYSVRRGFVAAGGSITGLGLTHEAGGDGIEAAVDAARSSQAEVIAVCATGSRAASIIRALRAAGVSAAVLADPLATEDFSRPALGRAGRGVYSAAPWDRELDTAANRAFVADFRASYGRIPDAYAALGHDTGRLVVAAHERGLPSWTEVARTLSGRVVAGVRGAQRVHAGLGSVATPVRIRQVVGRGSGTRNQLLATHGPINGVAAPVDGLTKSAVAAYFNEYLTT